MDYKKLLAGGAIAIGLVGIVCYLSGECNSASSIPSINKKQLLIILKDLKRELLNPLINLSSIAQYVKEQTRNALTNDQLREFLLTKTPIQEQIEKAINKTYEKHGVSEDSVEYSIDTIYKNDSEVQSAILEIEREKEAAFTGIPPKISVKLPDFLTAGKTIEIISDMYDATKFVTVNKLSLLKAQGISLNPNGRNFALVKQELEAEGEVAKLRVFTSYGLTDFEEPPNLIIHHAIEKYKDEPEFLSRLSAVEQDFRDSLNLILAGNYSVSEEQRLKEKFKGTAKIEEINE